jgi:hypothetical protein
MAKQVYLFDSETGIYCGDYLAQACPIVEGDHITPTHSTDIKPPKCKENEYPVFSGGKWSKKTIEPVAPIDPPKEDPAIVARYMRDKLLRDADIAINKLEDIGSDASLIRKHRQNLRDVPQQEGFPNNIDWPGFPVV